MKNEIYNVDFFIRKLQSIPEDKWCANALKNTKGQMCVMGLCDPDNQFTPEIIALARVLNYQQMFINNGDDPRYQQPTLKQRILAALYDIKKLETPYQVTHIYIPHIVKIDESILIEVNEN